MQDRTYYCFNWKSYLISVKQQRNGKFVDYIIKLHKTYGPIVRVPVGVQELVYINDGNLLVELYQKEEFATRPLETFPALKEVAHGSARGQWNIRLADYKF